MMDATNHNRLAEQTNARIAAGNPRAVAGNNQPPSPIESAKEALQELGAFLQEHPVIQNADDAKQGGAYVERTRIALNEARKERDAKTSPLNEALAKIRGFYDLVREKTKTNRGGALEAAYTELKRRLTEYANAVERERIAEANRLRAEAEAKEQAARQAEASEQEAIVNAAAGECTDVAGAIENADAAFADFQKANRAAAVAERDVPVRLGSVMGNRALSMRTQEVLSVTDAVAALKALGVTGKIRDAILSSARDYRREFNELPPGVTAAFERSI